MAKRLKCFTCKALFDPEELIGYKTHNYCKDCYNSKIELEKFAEEICKIFCIKAPGPKIYAQRKRLKDMFGYNDEDIIDCLHYLFEEKKVRNDLNDKKFQTLGLVTPSNIDEMRRWKKANQFKISMIAKAMEQSSSIEEKQIVVEKTEKKEEKVQIDWSFLEDEEE